MKPHEFEIGKVYKTDSEHDYYTLVRISGEYVFRLVDPTAHVVFQQEVSANWGGEYEEIPLSDLSEFQMEAYLKHFPDEVHFSGPEPADCTCSNDQIFNGGCKCGAFQKEMA